MMRNVLCAFRFKLMGFRDPTTALAVLSGAHNIGQSRVTAGPPIGNSPVGRCGQGLGPMTSTPDRWADRGFERYEEGSPRGA